MEIASTSQSFYEDQDKYKNVRKKLSLHYGGYSIKTCLTSHCNRSPEFETVNIQKRNLIFSVYLGSEENNIEYIISAELQLLHKHFRT